jgi:outer membrane lipoprotein-sorting protein
MLRKVTWLAVFAVLVAASPALLPAHAETPAAAPIPTVKELLSRVDANLNSDSRSSTMKMTVVNDKRVRTFEMRSFAQGEDTAAIEYLSPARDKGTRMLKKGDELWLYMPAVEKTQKISGHMMRQGMMGSDMSYEDMMGSTDWDELYDGVVEGTEQIDGRLHYKVVLTAKDETVTYPKRITWVDAETLIPARQELYALSGMLLKRWEMSDVKEFEGGRKFPTKMKVSDQLKQNSYTEIEITEVQFSVALPEEVFTMRWLERGGS